MSDPNAVHTHTLPLEVEIEIYPNGDHRILIGGKVVPESLAAYLIPNLQQHIDDAILGAIDA